jgi:hypothetical protein
MSLQKAIDIMERLNREEAEYEGQKIVKKEDVDVPDENKK